MNSVKKDYVKIAHAKDNRFIENEKKHIEQLQSLGLYPEKYLFPLTLQYELTTHCNVRCKHCYNNSGITNDSNDRMTPEEWKRFSKFIVSKGGIFQCVISGGEPLLLGDDLFEIMDILHNDGTSFLVISNGFLLSEDKVKRFGKYHFKWFQVSIDGFDSKYHDNFRQREGSWERAINGAYLITKEGIPLTIAHSVTPGNLKYIEKMCKLAYELGAGNIILGEVTPSGRSANALDLILNYEEKNFLYEKIEELSLKYSGKMSVERSATTKNQMHRYLNTPNSGAIIRPNGDIRLDCMAPFVIGNVLDDNFEEIWLEKASNCWNNPKVLEYINGYSDDNDFNNVLKNYFDEDIRI